MKNLFTWLSAIPIATPPTVYRLFSIMVWMVGMQPRILIFIKTWDKNKYYETIGDYSRQMCLLKLAPRIRTWDWLNYHRAEHGSMNRELHTWIRISEAFKAVVINARNLSTLGLSSLRSVQLKYSFLLQSLYPSELIPQHSKSCWTKSIRFWKSRSSL